MSSSNAKKHMLGPAGPSQKAKRQVDAGQRYIDAVATSGRRRRKMPSLSYGLSIHSLVRKRPAGKRQIL